MTAESDPDYVDEKRWWTISVTAMSEADAISAAREIQERFPQVYADAVDPKAFMTCHLDRWSAQLVRDGLAALAGGDRDCENLIADFDSWLAQARPDTA